jgi:hypothetical protein
LSAHLDGNTAILGTVLAFTLDTLGPGGFYSHSGSWGSGWGLSGNVDVDVQCTSESAPTANTTYGPVTWPS